jgi:hypothetical protein
LFTFAGPADPSAFAAGRLPGSTETGKPWTIGEIEQRLADWK